VTTMVMRLLRLADPPKPADTADALALAICHLWRGPQTRLAVLARGVVPPAAGRRGNTSSWTDPGVRR
jgi:crossover junction endodeoxyribonuclease RuvC